MGIMKDHVIPAPMQHTWKNETGEKRKERRGGKKRKGGKKRGKKKFHSRARTRDLPLYKANCLQLPWT